jgi:asparagine synthase (glutamine-hydrolysing)
LELRSELSRDYTFQTKTDTEVLLAAYVKWGESCLDRLIGMFAFVIWDETGRKAFGARDRFGVKPLYYHLPTEGGLWVSSEIKALHAAGVVRRLNPSVWASYLAFGMYDHTETTFWNDIQRVAPGSCFQWTLEGGLSIRTWYDASTSVLRAGLDPRPDDEVADQLLALLEESVRLRFRADVPVGICLSGGLDSSLLLKLVHRVQGADSNLKTFTFYCGDSAYDELPWVEQMLAGTNHPASFCRLIPGEVPELAGRVQRFQDEPFGGLPTLGMSKVHERAVAENVTVLLDGNGLDEGWAGYEYYQRPSDIDVAKGPVQGSRDCATRVDCLKPQFAALARRAAMPTPFSDSLLDLQYRDLKLAKIPRAMRFADRVSMMHSRELREPFLDHRIVELGLRQPAERKLRDGQGKWLLRQLAQRIVPDGVREAPKRPVQTPQREWLRGPLKTWACEQVESAVDSNRNWLEPDAVRGALTAYHSGDSDNSNYIWQWISLGMFLA